MNEYFFKQVNANNLGDLVPVFKNAFGRDITVEELYDKMNTFYCPVSFLGFVGYFQNEFPCSYYGVYPVYADIKGKKVLISQSGDTMTHSEHVGRGLFYESAELTYQLSKENGITGVFGFPSKTSYPGFKKKLGWFFPENINKYTFKVPILPLAFLRTKSGILNTIYSVWLTFIMFFFKKGSYFKGSVFNAGQDGISREEDFWKYKLQKGENKIIVAGGANAVLKINGRIGVGDIDITNETDIAPIIKKLKWFAFLTFNSQINFFVSPGTLLDDKLSVMTPAQKGLPVGYRDFTDSSSLADMKYTYFDFDTF